MVSSACTGSGFPVEWTNVTDATYWFYSSAYKRQFTAGYKITDYNTTTGLAIGKPFWTSARVITIISKNAIVTHTTHRIEFVNKQNCKILVINVCICLTISI